MIHPEVADEANPGVEPSPTGWAHVGGHEVLDACCSGLACLSLLLCCGGSAFFSCPSSNGNQATPGGRSEARAFHESVSIEKSFGETFRLSLKGLRCPLTERLPWQSSPYNSCFGMWSSGMRIMWPAHLTWALLVMEMMLVEFAYWRTSVSGILSC